MNETLFYFGDGSVLREKLARAERDNKLPGRVWTGVRRRCQTAPERFPWFAPFVAVVTRSEKDLESARNAIRQYVASLEARQFSAGLQFHFWCYAFPHARWTLYFHWLRSLGAWSPTEADRLRDALLTFQFVNFFPGMRSKPEPDCVDNQTLSLCFSNALVGQLFASDPDASALAVRIRDEGMRRLPTLLGGFPPGGYSGEGSTYMDVVVGPAIPLVVELLERVAGGEWFNRTLPPNGGSAAAVARMVAREWTPTGLLLPWDHYGYCLPVRACLAYAARRTGEARYLNLLEHYADWSYDIGSGWGVDDLVWTLAWWPETLPASAGRAFESWTVPETGAALVAEDDSLYLMQMWDESTPQTPHRAHVNPNALVLSAYGSPLTVDGAPASDCQSFNYPDTWVERKGVAFGGVRTNFGSGCGGAHSVLLVDDWEGLRAMTDYEQARLVSFDAAAQEIVADATPLYRERNPDARCVRRRSRLCGNRFWLIEDIAAFDRPHELVARWWLRPERIASDRGVWIETAEGVRLWLVPFVGPDNAKVEKVAGYPKGLDGASLRFDFRQQGRLGRWLWLAWPDETRSVAADISQEWEAVPDPDESLEIGLLPKGSRLPFTMPAFLLGDHPVVRRWWYRREVTAPNCPWWLRLPHGMGEARLWVDHVEQDLTPHRSLMASMAPQIPMATRGKKVEIIVRVDTGAGQEEGRDRQGAGFWGQPAIMVSQEPRVLPAVTYKDDVVTVRSSDQAWHVPHKMMEAP